MSKKPLVNKKPKPKESNDNAEFVLDKDKLLSVIKVIDNQGKQMEKTPCSFIDSDEEDLRNILLVSLNSLFEGSATGETFLNKGKTDIYLNIAEGKILVFECKFWKGKEYYLKAISQILDYLTWRQNYGVIISFSENKKFTNVIDQIKDVVREHDTYKKGAEQLNKTHFVSQHNLPSYKERGVEIHHLFYNLYC